MYSFKKAITYVKTWGIKSSFQNIMYTVQNAEIKKHYGSNNPDKTIYIIRCVNDKSRYYNGPINNLLANYFYVLTHLRYANEKGYISVVDQLNYPVYNSLRNPVNGTLNAWEYFWKQPGEISLDEAYMSRNVILSKRKWFGQWDMGYDAAKYRDSSIVNAVHSLCVPLNVTTAEHVNREYNKLLVDKGKILGVCFRYGGYSKDYFYHGDGHPIQPEISELADIVEKRLAEWNMELIFMTSDSIDSVEYFKKRFGNRLIVMPRIRCKEGVKYKTKQESPMYCDSQMFQTTLDYLTEMELLARCNALCGAVTSGLRYAVVQNNMQYEHCEIIERGFFEDKRKKGKIFNE
jgi:hypothetical protein